MIRGKGMSIKNNDVLVCRCKEVTEREILEAVKNGATTVDAVKRATQAGMGLCQSKSCYPIIARSISKETGIPVSEIIPMKLRPPVRPIKIKSLDQEVIKKGMQ